MSWHVIFYDEKNNEPVKVFILNQSYKARAEILHVLDLLHRFDVKLGRPYVTKLNKEGLRELRIKHSSDIYRIFFFASEGQVFVLLHAILKKVEKTPIKDIELAMRRMEEYKARE